MCPNDRCHHAHQRNRQFQQTHDIFHAHGSLATKNSTQEEERQVLWHSALSRIEVWGGSLESIVCCRGSFSLIGDVHMILCHAHILPSMSHAKEHRCKSCSHRISSRFQVFWGDVRTQSRHSAVDEHVRQQSPLKQRCLSSRDHFKFFTRPRHDQI